MTWISPAAERQEYDGRMPDDERVRLRLTECSVEMGKAFDNKEPQPQIVLRWVTVDPKYLEFEVTSWCGFSFGMSKTTSAPSKLRQLINALTGRAHDAEIGRRGGIDKETLEFSIDGSQIDGKIEPGIEVDAIGTTLTKKDDEGNNYRVWRIEKYRSKAASSKTETVKPANGNGRPPVKPAPAGKPDFAKAEAGF